MAVTLNASTSTGYIQTADTSGDLALQSNGTTQFTVASTGAYGQLKSGTAVASTSGTSIDFTSIPSWVKRITVMFNGVSTNGTSNIQIQIGSSTFSTTNYTGAVSYSTTTVSASTFSTGFAVSNSVSAGNTYNGMGTICLLGSNVWTYSAIFGRGDANAIFYAGSVSPTLSGTLDRVRITTVNGTDAFDAGSINILYEG